MDCYQISTVEITALLQSSEISEAKTKRKEKPCPVYVIQGWLPRGIQTEIMVRQCGTVAHIVDCNIPGQQAFCPCTDENESQKISKHIFSEFFFNKKFEKNGF